MGMTIAGKINALFIAVVLLLVCLITGFAAQREYQLQLEQLLRSSLATAAARPDLQLQIYRRDEIGLEQTLAEFLEPPAVAVAIARDSLGEALVQRHRPNMPAATLPEFSQLRAKLSPVDVDLSAFDASSEPTGKGLWSSLLNSQQLMHLSIPVLTGVNPGRRDLAAQDFAAALLSADPQGSQRVIGYIQLGIARGGLTSAIAPVVRRVMYVGLAFATLFGAVVVVLTRRITRPLSQLAQLADDAALGKLKEPVEIHGSSEIRDIALVLNSVIGGLSKQQKVIDAGHQLLSMKVDERTSQLSERDIKLSEATQEINETKNQLQQLAYYDGLTSLPNRRLFTEQLSLLLELNKRNSHTLALLFVDLDNFKRINDSLGHDAGDLLLQVVAGRLSDCVRGSDRVGHYVESEAKIDVARLGGDEFTVVLNQLDQVSSAALVAQRLVDALVEPMLIQDHELVVKPSIGIAIAPGNGADVESLLKAAGTAMHHAKNSARDDFLYYREDMEAVGVGRLKLEADLRKAVEREELVLHYQPQVNINTGSVVGAEALLRWEHPELGLVPPAQFVPLAEEVGLIAELGDWVLLEACRQLREFEQMELKLPRVAINISPLQFGSVFSTRVKEVLEETGLAPDRLELGLSEAIMMDNDPDTIEALQSLKQTGVYLSVDDFGAGYSPLSYLGRYSLDALRIDRSFVAACDNSEAGARLVTAIIAMAKGLNLGMVAEGVETEDQYRLLASNGAHVLQGYLFSAPVPAQELKALLAPWHFMEQVQSILG
jgi:diguanylate cyclase (GGDEF)-like protein